ncbi:receptor-like protein 15 isoform X2 [Malania oleifera]|uniref:receptor-like protein 15 isoform X2 n=1 Tax=Malania oleifera TaxID=397392 RepID=UPI0025AE5F00|nr:receptor-like protein 15 isoform X2 [Malania oleifera]
MEGTGALVVRKKCNSSLWALKIVAVLLLFLLLTCSHGGSSSSSRGCHAEERKALLRIKDFIKSNWTSTTDILPSWVGGEAENIDCCKWERVKCNPTTGRLMDLSLFNINNIITYDEDWFVDEDWFLNASLFLPFQDLTTLNLSHNSISHYLPNQGFEKLTSLKKLEVLDLGYNNFNNTSIFRSLGQFTSLKTLILCHNDLDGFFPVQDTLAFRNLEVLNLKDNFLSGSIPPSIRALPSLKALSLARNKINGSLPPVGEEFLATVSSDASVSMSRRCRN